MSLPPLPLPEGITSHMIDCRAAVGLQIHILSAGGPSELPPPAADTNTPARPLVLLHHGFPELAYTWRKIMLPLAAEGYHVVAVDQRGYGRTSGWEADAAAFESVDLRRWTPTQLVRDTLALVAALGYARVQCIVGHNFGAVSAGFCALARPDVFRGLVTMSHPFSGAAAMPGPPPPAAATAGQRTPGELLPSGDIDAALAALDPPRKHYKSYNSTAAGAADWDRPAQGTAAFLRGYFHVKSAAWAGNAAAAPLPGWTAPALARLPGYYVLPLDRSMPQTVAAMMAGEDAAATAAWLPDADVDVYAREWARTGFLGGLTWYRALSGPVGLADQRLLAGKRLEQPSLFVSGARDWGNYQQPGALERGQRALATDFRGVKLIDGAGHWVQQEQPERVVEEIGAFLKSLKHS